MSHRGAHQLPAAYTGSPPHSASGRAGRAIVVAAVVGLVAGLLVYAFAPSDRDYAASALVVLVDAGSREGSPSIAAASRDLEVPPELLATVAKNLGETEAEALGGRLSLGTEPGVNMVQITARADELGRAKETARVFADAYVEFLREASLRRAERERRRLERDVGRRGEGRGNAALVASMLERNRLRLIESFHAGTPYELQAIRAGVAPDSAKAALGGAIAALAALLLAIGLVGAIGRALPRGAAAKPSTPCGS